MTQTVYLNSTPVTVFGKILQKGDKAKPFMLANKELNDLDLTSFGDKRKVLNIFPSIDTATCAMSVRHFNQDASSLKNTVVLCISADLPFAQTRFCAAEGIKNVTMLSLFRNPTFKQDYGVEILDSPMRGLAARAVIILDEKNTVLYSELVTNISDEPNYDKAIAALK